MSGNRSSRSLQERVALISGGAQGIGRAIARRFQEAGARVVILDCDAPTGLQAAVEMSSPCAALPVEFVLADVLSVDQIRQAIDKTQDVFGRIDVLVNNAGVEIERPFEATSLADWDRTLGVNLKGAFLLTQAALPLFPARGGAIVNIGSVHATHAFPDSLAYACSKAALVAFTRNLALELAPRHIRVNTISPGYIDTRLWEEYLSHATDPEGLAAQITGLHPVGRRGGPADVAEAALFLATESSSFVTGTDLLVDGGLTLRAHP